MILQNHNYDHRKFTIIFHHIFLPLSPFTQCRVMQDKDAKEKITADRIFILIFNRGYFPNLIMVQIT